MASCICSNIWTPNPTKLSRAQLEETFEFSTIISIESFLNLHRILQQINNRCQWNTVKTQKMTTDFLTSLHASMLIVCLLMLQSMLTLSFQIPIPTSGRIIGSSITKRNLLNQSNLPTHEYDVSRNSSSSTTSFSSTDDLDFISDSNNDLKENENEHENENERSENDVNENDNTSAAGTMIEPLDALERDITHVIKDLTSGEDASVYPRKCFFFLCERYE